MITLLQQTIILKIAFLKLVLLILFFSSSTLANSKLKYAITTENFALPDDREIQLQAPKIWNYQLKRSDENTPPVLTYHVIDKERNDIFQLNISLLWSNTYELNINSNEAVKQLAIDSAQNILPYSDEDKIDLITFEGQQGKGYYYELTDSNAAPHEYQYLLQGTVKLDGMVLIYSLFANETNSILQEATINIIKSAKIISHKQI